jgi:hypothetical protein
LWHKGTQNEVEILKNLRGIFVSPKKQKELETHIKMMSKDIEREISWLKRDSIKNPWFKDGNDLEIKKLKTFYPAVDYLRSQLQIVPQKTKTKSFFIKIGLSIASTVIYHALTQIQTSINKYGHEDPRSIALICVEFLLQVFWFICILGKLWLVRKAYLERKIKSETGMKIS